MKSYDPDKELHKIRRAMARELDQLGPAEFVKKINAEAAKIINEHSWQSRVRHLPDVKIKHRKAA